MKKERNFDLKPCSVERRSEGEEYLKKFVVCLCRLIGEKEKLKTENKRLQKELNEAIDDNYKNVWKVQKQAERGAKYAKDENARLREALAFYAELDGNGIQLYGDMDSKALEFVDGESQPFGKIARDALKAGA